MHNLTISDRPQKVNNIIVQFSVVFFTTYRSAPPEKIAIIHVVIITTNPKTLNLSLKIGIFKHFIKIVYFSLICFTESIFVVNNTTKIY